jgi:hypothetical protein
MCSRRRRGGDYMRKDLIITALLTFCLAGVLFAAIPTMSQETLEYDPWKDVNDDGKLDILDIVQISSQYGATGTPINKTALLFQLLAKIEQLNATITGLQSDISELEANLAVLSSTKLGRPDYDSGWFTIAQWTELTLQHGLNTTELIIYIIGRGWYGISQMYCGGCSSYSEVGAYWSSLTSESIMVTRFKDDDYWAETRVIIWKIPQP